MERPRKQKRVYYSAGLFTRGTALYGALLFFVAHLLWFIQLFQDAAARKAAGQAPPEGYTVPGIVGQVLILGVIVWLIILLMRERQGMSRLSRPKRYLLMSVLTVAWGMVYIVGDIIDIFVYPEFILFLDVLTLAAAVVAPAVLLQLADIQREPPDDLILLFIGIGGTAFAVISLLIYALVLKKSYSSFFRLAPELAFRIAAGLYGASTLFAALKLRGAAPIAAPVPREEPRQRYRQEEELARESDWMAGFDAQTATAGSYGGPAPQAARPSARTDPSAGLARPAESLLSAARRQLSLPEEPRETVVTAPRPAPRPVARPPRPKNGQGTGAAARELNGQEALSRWQSQRMRRVNEFEEERWQRQQLERPPIAHPYADAKVRRISCPDCGKRVPEDFPVCPRCGRPL